MRDLTQKKITQELGLELLPHPPYSLDIASLDYHFSRSLEHTLRGTKFNKVGGVKIHLKKFFKEKSKDSFEKKIERLLLR